MKKNTRISATRERRGIPSAPPPPALCAPDFRQSCTGGNRAGSGFGGDARGGTQGWRGEEEEARTVFDIIPATITVFGAGTLGVGRFASPLKRWSLHYAGSYGSRCAEGHVRIIILVASEWRCSRVMVICFSLPFGKYCSFRNTNWPILRTPTSKCAQYSADSLRYGVLL